MNQGDYFSFAIQSTYIVQMNFEDELGVSPRTEGGINRQNFREQVIQQVSNPHLSTETGMQEKVGKKSEEPQLPSGWTRFIKLAYYEQYFKVSEEEVKQRIKTSFSLPYSSSLVEESRLKADFYGPFWILTTLVFLLGFVGNFSNYLLSKFMTGDIWQKYFFKLEFMRQAIILIYTYGLGVPVTIYFAIKINTEKIELELPSIICLYGYSLFCFIPAILLCILPLSFLHWLSLLCAFGNSTLFLIANLQKYSGNIGKNILILIIGVAQFILILCLKLIFLELL